jgi:hypothetical protein
MRALLLTLGVLLLLGGGYVVVRGLSVTTDKDTLKVGPLEASVEQKKTVPTWMGGLAAAVGAAMIIAGASAKRAGA